MLSRVAIPVAKLRDVIYVPAVSLYMVVLNVLPLLIRLMVFLIPSPKRPSKLLFSLFTHRTYVCIIVLEVILMTKRVYIIASFNIGGDVQPLWLRLSLEPDAPCYKIENCVCTKKASKYQNYSTYRCTVTYKNLHHEIGLHYYPEPSYWTMTISNSSAMAKM